MQTEQAPPGAPGSAGQEPCAPLEERLERGEVIFYPACPFALPDVCKHITDEHVRCLLHLGRG